MIDLETASQMGIVVCNQPGRTAAIVGEHLFGLMMAVAKRAAFQTAELKPESTEGGRRVSILKWPEGALLNLG